MRWKVYILYRIEIGMYKYILILSINYFKILKIIMLIVLKNIKKFKYFV